MAYIEIIIKISEEIYKNIQSKSTEIQAEGYAIENAILNGTPLDDIKTEINNMPKTYPFWNHIDTYVKDADVIKIIDKHTKEGDA